MKFFVMIIWCFLLLFLCGYGSLIFWLWSQHSILYHFIGFALVCIFMSWIIVYVIEDESDQEAQARLEEIQKLLEDE